MTKTATAARPDKRDPSLSRICLSRPHVSDAEEEFVADAFARNWVVPLGPHVDAFEREFAAVVDGEHGLAVCSGTAALHLALKLVGVRRRDEVLVSTLTFAASVVPTVYEGAVPVFAESELESWNMDAVLLSEELDRHASFRAWHVLAVWIQSRPCAFPPRAGDHPRPVCASQARVAQ